MNKITSYLILTILLIGCLMVVPNGQDARDVRVMLFCCFGVMAVALYIAVEVDMLGGLLMLYSAVQLCRGTGEMIELFALLGIGLFYVTMIRSGISRQWLYDAICVIVVINVCFQVMQYFRVYWLFQIINDSERCLGVMANINETSALMGMCLPVFLRKGRWWGLPLIGLGLVLAHSWQGVVAAAMVLIVWYGRGCGWRLVWTPAALIFSAVVMFMVFVKPIDFEAQKHLRLDIWEASIKAGSVKPFFGWGFNQYSQVIPLLTSAKYLGDEDRQKLYAAIGDNAAVNMAAAVVSGGDKRYFTDESRQYSRFYVQAHNEYVEMLFAGGMAGLFLMLAFLGVNLYQGWKQADEIPFLGLLSACVASLFGFQWHLMPLILITLVYLALIRASFPSVFPLSLHRK